MVEESRLYERLRFCKDGEMCTDGSEPDKWLPDKCNVVKPGIWKAHEGIVP